MTSIGSIWRGRVRRGLTTIALLAVCGLGLPGVANAAPPKFDIQSYSTCTATTAPRPDQDFDGVVASCCQQAAGIPTPSTYGMACVAAVDNPAPDYRPTIVLPSRPQSLTDTEEQALMGGPNDIGDPDLPFEPAMPGDPNAGGPPPFDPAQMGDLGGPR